MAYDCIVVGGGMAGLTAAAYACRSGLKVLVMEKGQHAGGLVSTFEHDGFMFDGGIRALENSGIILPMLRQLGIDLHFVKNDVTIGIADDTVRLSSKESLKDYQSLLNRIYPGFEGDIGTICNEIARVMQYMDVLYGIDNPLFLDLRKDKEYLTKTILPWMFKYALTMPKISKLGSPVEDYLGRFTDNRALIDIIAQHFFKATPTFFALSYFSLYLDYQYPLGGTGTLAKKMEEFVLEHGGQIKTSTEASELYPLENRVVDSSGQSYAYRKLVWAADMKGLYNSVNAGGADGKGLQMKVEARREVLKSIRGGDSILTIYLALDMDCSYFAHRSSPHFFYTPNRSGLGAILGDGAAKASEGWGSYKLKTRGEIESWLQRYLELTTYEISCPVMRDEIMAPKGKTGLIVSTLMDYDLVDKVRQAGWYEDFKTICCDTVLDVMEASIYPGIKGNVISSMVSTPLTLARLTGNTDGAITGWAFTNSVIPAVSSLPRVATSVVTPIPDVLQAGQWVFSPSGLPISILTGKLAADRVIKQLKGKIKR